MKKKYTYIDLFCGAGGLSLGFGNIGFDLKLANDISEDALNTFRRNLKISHPRVPNKAIINGKIEDIASSFDDITPMRKINDSNFIKHETKNYNNLLKKSNTKYDSNYLNEITKGLKNIDVLIGGPPCQGFSLIGRAKRLSKEIRNKGFVDDPQNHLFEYFLYFVEKLSPKIVLIENVSGLNSAGNYKNQILESLSFSSNGYITQSEILNTKDFGIPQNRKRIFFLGIRKDFSEKNNLIPEMFFDSLRKHNAEGPKLKEIFDDLPQIKSNPKPYNYNKLFEIPFGKANSFGQEESNTDYSTLIKSTKTHPYIRRINIYKKKNIIPEKLYNHKSRYHNERDLYIYKNLIPGKYLNHPYNSKAMKKVSYGIKYKSGKKTVKNFHDKYFKLDPNGISKTIIAHLSTDGNSYVHPGKFPRSISAREAARIQTFPDWYIFTGTLRNQLKQIGNAVPPLLAKIMAKEIKLLLDSSIKDEK